MRRLEADEDRAVDAALDAWGEGVASRVRRLGTLVCVGSQRLRLFLATPEAADEAVETPWETEHVGLMVGTLRAGDFVPSLEGIQVLAGTERVAARARLDAQGAAAFLYGRRIAADHVRANGEPGTPVVVYGPQGDVLGWGRVDEGTGDLLPARDLGWYLRQGG